MRRVSHAAALFGALGWLIAAVASPASSAEEVDHYVLALSWSPTYCADRDPSDAPLQCGLEADRTFIVHGFWPNGRQSEPEYCPTDQRPPGRRLVNSVLDLMPSRGLIAYQWRKHGACSQLSADAYFDLMRRAAARVRIPAGLAAIDRSISVRPGVLREAFLRTNPDLREDDFYIRCKSDELVDVRICLSPQLDFVNCPNVRARRCRSRLLDIDPPR